MFRGPQLWMTAVHNLRADAESYPQGCPQLGMNDRDVTTSTGFSTAGGQLHLSVDAASTTRGHQSSRTSEARQAELGDDPLGRGAGVAVVVVEAQVAATRAAALAVPRPGRC